LDDEKYATPVNLTLQSLFDQIDVYLQDRLISRTELYPYKSIFDTLLNTNEDELKSKMRTQMFYLDTKGAMEQTTPDHTPINMGLILRNNLVKDGEIAELIGPLYVDVLHQDNMLLDKVNVKLKLYQSSNAFRLLSTNTNALLEIIDAKLLVYYAKIKEAIPSSLQYNFMQSEMYSRTLMAGSQNVRLDNLFQRCIPQRMIIALVNSNGEMGDLEKNPFNFQHFNLKYINVVVNGKPLEMDFEKGQFYMAYLTLFDSGCPCLITPEMYKDGHTLYQFFPPHTKDGGNVRFEMQFSQPLAATTTLIIYSSFPKSFKINANREIL
jgi:hypothetical protein